MKANAAAKEAAADASEALAAWEDAVAAATAANQPLADAVDEAQAALDANTDPALTEGLQTALDNAQKTLDDAVAADPAVTAALAEKDTTADAAEMAEADAVAALEDAANKPVTDEVRIAVDALLEGKELAETATVTE